ncbi:hypothetical protein BD410DRAFT_776198 [Rickenella mellea]|uniref:Zn(2)-C6 fungal-type domain-containing protein n=1 Tax=Rickenella mellea TaxID=50990 RepID=A0A4Y7PQY1_9AGAM|nr:hypothetical protein BD410DRAFT_776198 [Rickenella mellea]
MSSTAPSRSTSRKRKPSTERREKSPDDHRKRRRNRTTQSCLNCHGSKRMCDRKRPACGRCVKLGLSGLCVYEVDDPTQRVVESDETLHLKARIAELEGFIREFKKKPLHRWLSESPSFDPADEGQLQLPSSSGLPPSDIQSEVNIGMIGDSSNISSPDISPVTPPDDDCPDLRLPSLMLQENSNPTPKCALPLDFTSLSTGDGPLDMSSLFVDTNLSGGKVGGDQFDNVFADILQYDIENTLDASARQQNCDCMKNSIAFATIMELAPHLRSALDVLRTLPDHDTHCTTACDIVQRIQDLCMSTSNVLESMPADAPLDSELCDFSPSTESWADFTLSSPTASSFSYWNSESLLDAPGPRDDDYYMTWDR